MFGTARTFHPLPTLHHLAYPASRPAYTDRTQVILPLYHCTAVLPYRL